MYKLIKNSKGDRWMRDGKFVSAEDVPEAIKQSQDKQCLICGGAASHPRLINEVKIYLCDKDYYSAKSTYGALVGLLNKEGIYGNQDTSIGSPA